MGKLANLTYSYDDLIDLSLGDPDITTDERIIKDTFEDTKKMAIPIIQTLMEIQN